MPSTFFGLNIAVSGMNAYHAGLTTTGHNIANAKTKGYSKQQVEQRAKVPISLRTSYGMLGAGVDAYDITSSRDAYFDFKYRKSAAVYGKYATTAHFMTGIGESLYAIDEKSGGVSNSLDSFFKQISALTEHVDDTTIRTQVIGCGDNLMSYVREVANSLKDTQEEINSEIDSTVDKINAYAKQVASLTLQINTLEVYGSKANDLRDRRATVIDELSELVDVEVIEQPPGDGNGLNQFLVFIGDGVLVDSTVANQLQIVTRTTKDCQTDNEGLYDIRWSTGQDFNIRNGNLGGRLQGLFEMRDGNNEENFHATLTEFSEKNAAYGGQSTLTLVSDATSSANSAMLSKLNIPESDGVIEISNFSYQYESFEVKVAADGTYTYTFVLKEELQKGDTDHLQTAIDHEKTNAEIGDSIAFRGIPYYMAQLTEFVRTFSASFNQVQNGGYDLHGDPGCDLFVAKDIAGQEEFDMTEFLYNKKEGFYYLNGHKVLDSKAQEDYADKGYTLKEIVNGNGLYQVLDENQELVEEVYKAADDQEIFTFTSYTTKGEKASYYNMTALNAVVGKEILGDPNMLACSTTAGDGVAKSDNLHRMSALREDNTMFKQGTAKSFLAVIVATVGVDGKKIDACESNSEDILEAVENRRLSKSGVDEDEEGQNMIEYQNLLHYQYRVISIMNEVLDKLINGTGV